MSEFNDDFENLNENTQLPEDNNIPHFEPEKGSADGETNFSSINENAYRSANGDEFNQADESTGSTEATYASQAEERTDSYYMYHGDEDANISTQPFYKSNFKNKKKKRYVSVPAAVVAMVLTATVSITGSALVSRFDLFGKNQVRMSANNGAKVSVEDNISTSEKTVDGKKASLNSVNGVALSTPEIVDMVGPAVVGIINKTTYGNAYGYYGFFGGDVNEEIEQSSGSGVIISSDGYIVTNNHVVENATKISVILSNSEEYEAKVVGVDASTDLAVIKIEASGLTYAQMGTSSSLRVGETAIAIGNPLGQEFAGTTTQGIISGLNRSVTIDNKTMNLIQTDAAINPGNSGGALVNEYGHLIGINTAKISSDTLEGLGFAIPIDEAKPIIQELIDNGYVTGRPVIGIAGRAVTTQDAQAYNLKVGVYVSSLTPNGPAYMSGIKIGDIIVECDGEPIETVDDINEIKNKKAPGDEIMLKIYRKGEYKDIKVILGEENPNNG